eukprot:CAMPEP_0116871646 /NCGR_PEP_ID=MMETSP0463-20121206/2105_1 /TAXON_ID=181622 /ORGANISM="Strombidinopsis sp, Strain SopsisLIS2011" /LENGTH=30 /DNA_ID= /DNA_START= /DNA_END= /DNA_ORIENTATION=
MTTETERQETMKRERAGKRVQIMKVLDEKT